MDPVAIALGALALAIVAHAVTWFFKSPNKVNEEMSDRVTELERDHRGLELRHIEVSTGLIVKMEQLRVEMGELKDALKDLVRRLPYERNRGRDDAKAR